MAGSATKRGSKERPPRSTRALGFTRKGKPRRMGAISVGALRCAGRQPARLADSAAVGHRALGLFGSHDCDRQPELLHAVGQVPAQPM